MMELALIKAVLFRLFPWKFRLEERLVGLQAELLQSKLKENLLVSSEDQTEAEADWEAAAKS